MEKQRQVHKDGILKQIPIEQLQSYLSRGWQVGKIQPPWNKGLTRFTDERLRKFSESRKGIKIPKDIVEKRAQKTRGRKCSEEEILRRVLTRKLKNYHLTAESRKKISDSNKGRKISKQSIEKRKQTLLKRYGKLKLSGPMSEEGRKNISKHNSSLEFQIHQRNIKKKNHSFTQSKPEERAEKLLKKKFKNQVIRHYIDPKRYPYECDFYIKDLDLFIELNYHWSHWTHQFNKKDQKDIEKLKELKSNPQYKIDNKGRKNRSFYKSIIEVWTIRDVKKAETAKKNHLNYLVFYKEKEFDNWLNNYEYKESKKSKTCIQSGRRTLRN